MYSITKPAHLRQARALLGLFQKEEQRSKQAAELSQASCQDIPSEAPTETGKRIGVVPGPTLVFVRAEQDSRGRWARYHHTPTGGRVPITQDGFLLESGCSCLPGDAFLTIEQLETLLKEAKGQRRTAKKRGVR